MPKGLKIFLIIFGILIVANISVLDFFFVKDKFVGKKIQGKGKSEIIGGEESKIATDSCGLVCQQTIEEKINEELSRLPSPADSAGQSSISPSQSPHIPAKIPTVANGKPKVVYVPLVTSGSISSVSWTDISPSEFYFDLSSYPNAKEVRFEVYILSSNSDLGYARLYDVTNKRGVDFSDIQTSSSTFTRIESSGIKIWQGNNKYTVQLRSVNGTQVQLQDAKLKILY